MSLLDREVKKFLSSKSQPGSSFSAGDCAPKPTKLFYKGQMNSNDKQEHVKIKKTFSDGVSSTMNLPVKILIYYKSRKLSNLLSKTFLSMTQGKVTSSTSIYVPRLNVIP